MNVVVIFMLSRKKKKKNIVGLFNAKGRKLALRRMEAAEEGTRGGGVLVVV
jgi:hypothetical protein